MDPYAIRARRQLNYQQLVEATTGQKPFGPEPEPPAELILPAPAQLHRTDREWGPTVLQRYLDHAPRMEKGTYSNMAQATLVFHVFHALWSAEPNGPDYFLPRGQQQPQKGEWTSQNADGVYIPFSLKARQERGRLSEIKRGKQPDRLAGSCGRVIPRHDRSYTCKWVPNVFNTDCRTCGNDSGNSLCIDCFQAGDHQGHDVTFGQSFGFMTVCDCGVEAVWRKGSSSHCSDHTPSPSVPPPTPISSSIEHSIQDTLAVILDFIIETFQYSPMPSEFGKLSSNAEVMRAGMDQHSKSTAEPVERRGLGPWSCVLWSDEKHVLRETTRQIRDGTGSDWKSAMRMAREAEAIGRRVIATSDDLVSIFHAASMLQQIDLGVTLRSAADTFREQAAMTLLNLLADLAECTVGSDPFVFRRALTKALTEPRRIIQEQGSYFSHDIQRLKAAGDGVTRFEWLATFDVKMWKAPKIAFRKILMAVYHCDESSRAEISKCFNMILVPVFEHYLFQERESDTNLIYSCIHPFYRDGGAAFTAVKAGAINQLCNMAQAWYSGRIAEGRLLIEAIDIDQLEPKTTYNPDTMHFRSKKGLPLFGYLNALLRHQAVKELVYTDTKLLNRMLQFINPFVGVQAQRRARESHVEFEPEFHRTYLVMGEVAKLCRVIGECFTRAPGIHTLQALRIVKDRIFNDMLQATYTLPSEKYGKPSDRQVNDVLGNGNVCTLWRFIVSRSTSTSFHHYLHLIFAELLKGLFAVPEMQDGTIDLTVFLNDHLLATDHLLPGLPILSLIEDSLQKHVVISQVRLGHWARNGISMRAQVMYYTDGPIHEYTIDQEFFLLQVGLCTLNPLIFITAAIDRFELTEFFRGSLEDGNGWEGEMDSAVQAGTLADFLRLLISLVSDTATVTQKTQQQITRLNIIHILALNSQKYNSILKRLPERCTDRGSIEPILGEIADFKPPTTTAEGSYSLKDEFFDEVDPFFHHYQSNERDEARKVLLARLAKRNPGSKHVVLLPRKLDIPKAPGMFNNLADFLKQDIAVAVCHYAICQCIHMGEPEKFPATEPATAMPHLEGVFEAALHLCLLAIQVDVETFALGSQIQRDNTGTSMFHILWYIHTLKFDVFKPFMPTLNYIINIVIEHCSPDRAAIAREAVKAKKETDKAEAASAPENPAKSKGAARRQAIMAKLAKQQADFKSGEAYRNIVGEGDDEIEDESKPKLEIHGTCINCQDEVSAERPGGMLAMLQPSRVLREAANDREWLSESLHTPSSLDRATRHHREGWGTTGEPVITDGYPSSSLRLGINIQACGHLMHETCLAGFFDMTKLRHQNQLQRHQPENAARGEYICPLCKSLSNVLIPVDKTISKLADPTSRLGPNGGPLSLKDRIRQISNEGLMGVSDSQRIWDHHVESGELEPWFADRMLCDEVLDPSAREGKLRSVAKMVTRLRALTKPTSEQSARLRKRPHSGQQPAMYLPEDMVGYVVSMNEISQRGIATKGLTVAENLNETAHRTIKALVGTLQLELDLYFGRRYNRTALRVGIFARFLPDWYRAPMPAPVLSRDPMGLVVEAAAIAPDTLQSVIVLGYYLELSRTILGLATWARRCLSGHSSTPAPRPDQPKDVDLAEAMQVFTGFRGVVAEQLRAATANGDAESFLGLLTDDMLAKLLYTHTLPFLRRAGILYYSLHGIYPIPTGPSKIGCEYRRLLHVLDIPDPSTSLRGDSSLRQIVNRWVTQWSQRGRSAPSLEFPGIYELYRLPREFETLMLMSNKRRCEKCGLEPSVPAICMFCGKFVCLGGDCCSDGEMGECSLHMRECGGTVGMFLDLKRWHILFLFAGTGSFGNTPYLDVHGEVDGAMRRGHLQYLHEGRADELRRTLWLQHGIPSYTARRLELMTDGGGWGCL